MPIAMSMSLTRLTPYSDCSSIHLKVARSGFNTPSGQLLKYTATVHSDRQCRMREAHLTVQSTLVPLTL